MHFLFVVAAYAACVRGAPAPQGPGEWEKHSHPGWRFPKVYTPEPPEVTWYSQPVPGPASTSYEVSPSATEPASTSAPSVSITASASSSASSSASFTVQGPPDACAEVSASIVGAFSSSSGVGLATAYPTVAAGLAYECINSVPFNSSAAVDLMDSIRPYLDWQTTISYIADPPAEYAANVQAPYDFYAEYERIYTKAGANGYQNEYSFGFDLYQVFQRTHDGHFVYYPDSVTLIFSFGRTTPLVSVSRDGEEVPEVYVYADVLGASFGNISYTPSPLSTIDGEDAIDYLLNWAQYGSLQDPDALWNNVFYNLAQVSLGPSGGGPGTFAGGGRGRWIYPGPDTTLEFANGSSITTDNYANVQVPFDGIQNGEDIYRNFFTPPSFEPRDPQELVSSSSSFAASSSASSFFSSSSAAASTTIPAPGYPSPFIREKNNLNGGYFLEGADYDDVAVLNVASFVGATTDELPFQSVNTYLINEAVARGKTKLIIDVSANGGGTILQGYDLFKQLFPQILPYGANRFRAHEAFNLIGYEVSWYAEQVPRSLDLNSTAANIVSSAWNYMTDLDINYEPFASWDDKNGPHLKGPGPDPYTDILRWNLSDVLTPLNSGGIYVSGYLERANITQQPFAAENIIIVTDGYCASTCTIFSELMRQQAGIQTVALGGRPTKEGIIQAVGGVKGTNSLDYGYILYAVEKPFQIQHFHDGDYYANTALGEYSDLPFYRGTAYVTNARDGIREGDTEGVPLQFVYEPADCRIYYTPAMAVDQSAVWRAVADSAFNGVNQCVSGGLGGASDKVKRTVKPKRSYVNRRDISVAEHYKAMADRWVGKSSNVLGGDCVMLQ